MAEFSNGYEQSESDKTAYVPPPPTEITIRTLESDIKSMILSGGNFPKSEKIILASSVSQNKPGMLAGLNNPKSKAVIWVLVLAIIIIGSFIYFIYPFLRTTPQSDNQNNNFEEVPELRLPVVPTDLTPGLTPNSTSTSTPNNDFEPSF